MKMTDDAALVSVVMCTRNRAANVGSAVASVLMNSYPCFELIVIDQSDGRDTAEILEPIASSDRRLRYFHVDEAGLSRSYNVGIHKSRGSLVAFTDDDCIVDAGWIKSIVDAFAEVPEAALLYGQVLALHPKRGDLTPTLVFERRERLGRNSGPYRVIGMGANFAARRELFDSVGFFDEVLGGGGPLKSSQDFDLAYRVFRSGRVILLEPSVTVRHDGLREPEHWPDLLLNYGTGDGAFYTKHVRCRDPHAALMYATHVLHVTARCTAKALFRRGPEWRYLRGFLRGTHWSFRYRVDRRARLYVSVDQRTAAESVTKR